MEMKWRQNDQEADPAAQGSSGSPSVVIVLQKKDKLQLRLLHYGENYGTSGIYSLYPHIFFKNFLLENLDSYEGLLKQRKNSLTAKWFLISVDSSMCLQMVCSSK